MEHEPLRKTAAPPNFMSPEDRAQIKEFLRYFLLKTEPKPPVNGRKILYFPTQSHLAGR